jgi:NTP pyrophosphatase (non-canonical NTP hydrolase)
MDFNELRRANLKRSAEVFSPLESWSPGDWACAMAGEAGEACNFVKKLRRLEDGKNTAKDPQSRAAIIAEVGNELADTVIYADLLAARLGINLDEALRGKFNEVSQRMGSSVKL